MAIGWDTPMDLEPDIKKVLFGLIDIMLHHIDNVWRTKVHIKIQNGGHSDENDITNFGNVIFE
jgi:hypothetical protein